MLGDANAQLAGLPDPAPLLESRTDQLGDRLSEITAERDEARRAADDAQRDAEQRVRVAVSAAAERWSEREAELQRTIAATQDNLRQLHLIHEQAAGASATSDDQLDSVLADLQRVNERVVQAETRVKQQQAAAERVLQERDAHYSQQIHYLEQQLMSAQLAAQERTTIEAEATAAYHALEAELEEARHSAESLRTALEQQRDYDDLKRQIASYVPRHGSEADETLQHTKRLEDELVSLRVDLAEARRTSTAAHKELEDSSAQIARLTALNAELEADVMRVGDHGSDNQSAGLLTIVTGQRDRFRTRNAELEEELRVQVEALAELRGTAQQLQTDNLAMYEKVRYLERSGPTYPPGSTAVTIDEPYSKRYEQSLNPFEAFRGRVRECG